MLQNPLRSTVNRWKSSGMLDDATLQCGQVVIFELPKVIEILRVSDKKNKFNVKSTMEKNLIDEAVSTLDLQGSNMKESTVEDKDLQADASAGDTQQPNSETA